MSELDNFRSKYPDYDDVSDTDLASMLAKKYPDAYGDLPSKIVPSGGQNQEPQLEQGPLPGAELLSDIARPVLQGVGGGLGAILGTGTGGPGPGTLLGGGLGFAGGTELANRLDEFLGLRDGKPLLVELKSAAKNVAEGAVYEAGGQVIAAGAAPAFRAITKKLPNLPFTSGAAERKAGEIIAAQTEAGPLVAKNSAEAAALEEIIPGLKFSRGQQTGDPGVIQFERAAARGVGGQEVAAEQLERSAKNSEALQNFITKAKGSEGIGDVTNVIKETKDIVETGVESAGSQLGQETAALGQGVTGLEAGQTIRSQAKAGERTARTEASKLFNEVPEFEVDATPLINKIDELSKPLNKFEVIQGNIPPEFDQARELLLETGGKATPQDLQGLRNTLTDSLRDINTSASPNKKMARRISGLIGEVDIVLKESGEIQGIGQSTYKGKIISPEKLKAELKTIDKRIKDASIVDKKIDVDKTYAELQDAREIGIMQQVKEGNEQYAERLAKDYVRRFKKDPPLLPTPKKDVSLFETRKSEIENILSGAKEVTPEEMKAAGESLQTARQYFKKEVVGKFGKGPVGDILKTGFSGDKVSDAQIVSKFFRPGQSGAEGATKFMAAFKGDEMAMQAMEDAVKQDLLTHVNPVSGELTKQKLSAWLSKNNPALNKLGIRDKFKSLEAARSSLDDAIQIKTAFEKSETAKMLKFDAEDAIRKSFTDGKERSTAISIMKKISGNKKAVAGFQNSLIDNIIDNSQTTASDAFGNPIVSYASIEKGLRKFDPALKVAFKDSPQKLMALGQYRQALKKLQRGKASPLGGGSDTAENILTTLSKVSGMTPSRTINLIKGAVKPFRDLSDGHVNAILNRAAYDPDFATTLKMAATGRPIDVIETRLKGHLIAMGLRTGKGDK